MDPVTERLHRKDRVEQILRAKAARDQQRRSRHHDNRQAGGKRHRHDVAASHYRLRSQRGG